MSLAAVSLFVALVSTGLVAGSAYTTFFWFRPDADGQAAWFAELRYAIPRIGIPLFLLHPLAFLAAVSTAMLSWDGGSRSWLLASAAAGVFASAMITRIGHIPINQRVLALEAGALPPDAGNVQQRWWTMHIARSIALLVALTCMGLAVVT